MPSTIDNRRRSDPKSRDPFQSLYSTMVYSMAARGTVVVGN